MRDSSWKILNEDAILSLTPGGETGFDEASNGLRIRLSRTARPVAGAFPRAGAGGPPPGDSGGGQHLDPVGCGHVPGEVERGQPRDLVAARRDCLPAIQSAGAAGTEPGAARGAGGPHRTRGAAARSNSACWANCRRPIAIYAPRRRTCISTGRSTKRSSGAWRCVRPMW